MKSPKKSSKITKEWLEYIFTIHEGKKHQGAVVTVSDFKVKKGAAPGDGFNSELVMVECHAKVKNQESQDKVFDIIYQVAVKFLGHDPLVHEMSKFSKGHLKSSLLYSEIIPEFNNILSSVAPDEPVINVPELIFSTDSKTEFVLVLENLKANGYKNNDKMKGLDYHHLVKAVDQIAKLHALSYVFNKSQNFLEKYPSFHYPKEWLIVLKPIGSLFVNNCVKFLKSLENKEDLAKKLEKSGPSLIEKHLSIIQTPGIISCLNHGDFWNNNFMFSYQEESTPEGIKVIDWTNGFWGNPMYDLQYLIHTSTRREIRKNHLEEILQHYHSIFTSITTKLGVSVPEWTYDNFRKEWEETCILGLFSGITLAQITLSKSNPASQPQESSVLDHAAFFPVRALLNSIKSGMGKLMMTKPSLGASLMKGGMGMMLKPVCRELKAGTNEEMNSRVLDLICEADESGLLNIA